MAVRAKSFIPIIIFLVDLQILLRWDSHGGLVGYIQRQRYPTNINMSYAYLFKYIIIGDTGMKRK